MFENRTDLALEERESFEGNGGEIGGVALREWRCHGSSIRMTEVSILNEKGAESMGKPIWNLPDDGRSGSVGDSGRIL